MISVPLLGWFKEGKSFAEATSQSLKSIKATAKQEIPQPQDQTDPNQADRTNG